MAGDARGAGGAGDRGGGDGGGAGDGSRPDAYAPFRPRAARIASRVGAVVFGVGMVVLGLVVPAVVQVTVLWLDRLTFVALGLGGAWFLLRHGGVRALPDPEGLTVRNLLTTRRVTWAEIVSVRFGPNRPWAQLDLADGTTLAVMGIQGSDGGRAALEARRLATLVARHSQTERDD